MSKRNRIVFQLCMNIVPLLGVIFNGWSVFALIYSYWLETLAITFISSIIILTAQNSTDQFPHIKKAISYFIFRAGMLIFYMIFIVVFIGLMISEKQEGAGFVRYLVFIDHAFRYTILSLFVIKVLELIYYYFLSGVYKTTNPNDYYVFFDVRSVMIHFVIILGFFAFKFVSERFNNEFGIIAFAAVFVIIKSIADVVSIFLLKAENQNNSETSNI